MRFQKFAFSIIILLIPVLFVSGCVEGGDIFSAFTGQQKTVSASKDVLEVQDIQAIPDPVTADSTFTITFKVTNVGDASEGSKEARDVQVTAYDWGRCHPLDKNGKEITDASIDAFSEPAVIYPGSSEVVEWNFRAPTNEELGRMDGNCPIRFKVNYTYDAYTTADLSIISRERMKGAYRSGESVTVSPVQTQSRGPIKIDLSFDVQQPVTEGLVVPVLVKVKDVGSGMYNKVENGKLELKFPNDLADKVTCYNFNMSGSNGIFKNNKEIPLIGGETPVIRCDINTKDLNVRDIKTYNIRAQIIGYQYPLYEEKTVTVKSTYEQGTE